MSLPEWAELPGLGFEHGDNYSALEVVWSHPDGRVVIQHAPPGAAPDRYARRVFTAPEEELPGSAAKTDPHDVEWIGDAADDWRDRPRRFRRAAAVVAAAAAGAGGVVVLVHLLR